MTPTEYIGEPDPVKRDQMKVALLTSISKQLDTLITILSVALLALGIIVGLLVSEYVF